MSISDERFTVARREALTKSFALRPYLNIERALHFTRYFQNHGEQPLFTRWVGAMRQVMEHMDIHMFPYDLLAGRMGPEGRYGIFYPELESAYLLKSPSSIERELGIFYRIAPQDTRLLYREILPYWRGKTMRERFSSALPEDLRKFFYHEGNIYDPSFILHETATIRHSLQWALSYEKVLKYGFHGIAEQAASALQAEKSRGPDDKRYIFYTGVIELCEAIKDFSLRYAAHAESLAERCTPDERNRYIMLAELCRRVPWESARTFHEAVQAQWFTQFVSRIEQLHGGMISNGRMDQYLLPYFRKDIDSGRITREDAQNILEALWGNIAQCVRIQTSPAASKIYENNAAHWEHVTLGGVLPDGSDAANELSEILLDSASLSPKGYPLFCLRVHRDSRQELLLRAIDYLLSDTLAISFVNDDEVVPLLEKRGASIEEARNYVTAGCAEARLPNKHTYFSGSTWLNLGTALEMALYDGKCSRYTERVGIPTGDPRRFKTFKEFLSAFYAQLDHLQIQVFRQQHLMERVRAAMIVSPLLSCLHDLCLEQGMDINDHDLVGGINVGGQTSPVGLATVVDSLCAISDLVYREKYISMDSLIKSLKSNFQNNKIVMLRCRSGRKYGTGDPLAEEIARELESHMADMCQRHRNSYGGQGELLYVPVTGHVAMGRVTGALPDGRLAGAQYSEGVSPSTSWLPGEATTILQSVARSAVRGHVARSTRMLHINLFRQDWRHPEGRFQMLSLVRAWCLQGNWHLIIRFYDDDPFYAIQDKSGRLGMRMPKGFCYYGVGKTAASGG